MIILTEEQEIILLCPKGHSNMHKFGYVQYWDVYFCKDCDKPVFDYQCLAKRRKK